ncbi:MAG TPA: hypothetical protein VJS92_13520, partial [Candidatus Polarisedimenticolaceae bacterium]|nr:hypothetical protein [Candidatus Polarisedimenticolaceae bacterium]
LRPALDPRIDAVRALPGLERTAVDLSAGLAGGGRAGYMMQLERLPQDVWRVEWLAGPGVAWPPPRASKGDGLTSSAPPGGAP